MRGTGTVETVALFDEDRATQWEDYHLSGMPELIGSVHLGYALLGLASSGMLDRLRAGGRVPSAELLAELAPAVGAGLLRYLTVRGVLDEFAGGFRLTRRGELLTGQIALARLGFYLEAYGPVVRRLPDLLSGAVRYGVDVERGHGSLGRHSGTVSSVSYTPIVAAALEALGARRVLDLGCGGGSLLVELCQADRGLTGVGIDIAPEPIAAARRAAEQAGVADRLEFVVADAFDPGTWPDATDTADVVCGVGVLHERFRDGDDAVVQILDGYAKAATGGRALLIGEPEIRYDDRENDSDFYLVHVLTAQGIPRDRAGWLDVIARTGLTCRRIWTSAVVGPRTCFYELEPKD
jgi:SAM-dependent methyltransferase